MLLATIGDILTIRKHYQKTFTFNSDESVNDNSLTCFDVNKFKDKLEQLGDTHLTGNNLLNIFESCLIEVEMNEGDNFHMSIRDPNGSGNTNVGYSGKSNYDSYNHYEPSNMDDSRIYGSRRCRWEI